MVSNISTHIQDIVCVQLMRPRALTVQVAGSVCDMLSVDDPLDGLDQALFQRLMPFETELLLSPLFTPVPQDLEACEPALPVAGMPDAEVASLVSGLVAKSLHCPLSYGQREKLVPLMEVVIERYVRLLHLDSRIDPLLLPSLETIAEEGRGEPVGQAERWTLFSQAHRPVWNTSKRAQLLNICLQTMIERATFRLDKIRFLTDFVGSYRPGGAKELVDALVNLMDAYHHDSEHPVYNQQLEHYQGDNIRSQYCGPAVKAFRLTMAHALLSDFRHASHGSASK